MTCPADETVTSPTGKAFAVTFAPETAGGAAPVTVTCDPASDSAFNIGTTAVSCSASDAAGQTASCQFSIRVLKPPQIQYTKFMAFGDSITEGQVGVVSSFRIVDETKAYPTVLRQMLVARYTAQTITVVNAGLGGEFATGSGTYGRLQHALAANHPQVVILSEGTNDLNAGYQDSITPTANAMEDLTRLVLSFGVKVVIVGTIPPMRPEGPKAFCPDCVVPYNSLVKTLVSAKGARTVDTYTLLKKNLGTLIGDDGIHPTAAGYETMATTYFNAIVKWFEPDPGSAIAAGQAEYGNHH